MGAHKLVFVLRGENPISGASNGGSERENLATEWGTPSRRNPATEGFDSRRMIKKKPVGMSALTSLSGENPIGGTYRHFFE